MFDHVVFGVSDYAASKAFFLKALEPLGVAVVQEEGSPGERGTPQQVIFCGLKLRSAATALIVTR